MDEAIMAEFDIESTILEAEEQSDVVVLPEGPLKRLRTLAEVNASSDTIEVYIAEITPKATKAAIDAMKPLLPEDHRKVNLAHLRRPCTLAQLPETLQARFAPNGIIELLLQSARRRRGGQKSLYVLLCATCLMEEEPLFDAVSQAMAQNDFPPPKIHRIVVPQFSPTSPEQAAEWTAMYWPTSFKNNNPYGPHPGVIARAEAELIEPIDLNADACMRLARHVAHDGYECGLGEPVGVVVLERSAETGTRIVAVASDARFRGMPSCEEARKTGGRGNITAHAVMRAIGMVAQKRCLIDGKGRVRNQPVSVSVPFSPGAESITSDSDDGECPNSPASSATIVRDPPPSLLPLLPAPDAASNIFLDYPITEMEKKYFDPPTLAPKGYLCLQLELYVTHEPCIMCCMAILHSRFGRVVFENEMRSTGALIAERIQESIPLSIPVRIPAAPIMTKSAKRRRNRKNSKLRQKALKEAEDAKPQGPAMEYGLWWRGQLNWKFFCWQWRRENASTTAGAMQIESRPTSSNLSSSASSPPSEWMGLQRVMSPGEGPSSQYEDDLIRGLQEMALSPLHHLVHV